MWSVKEKPFAQTTLDQVAGCLKSQGTPKSIEDIEDAIRHRNLSGFKTIMMYMS